MLHRARSRPQSKRIGFQTNWYENTSASRRRRSEFSNSLLNPSGSTIAIYTSLDAPTQTLKSTFGFNSFRPHQREIIDATLNGEDVFALLPTGGGKSLCFQLPAILRPGLTVVVSPLIALMKDQVDQLQAAGVAATFLNSSLGAKDARSRLAGLHRGNYKLLYVSPERLMLEGWLELEFADGETVHLEAGDSVYIPGFLPHNEISTSDAFELLEFSVPAEMGTEVCDPPTA